jgi:hypothetical protein
MIDEMPCGYGTLRTTRAIIRHQVSHRPAQRSQQLQRLTILIVKSRSILNPPPSLQVFSRAPENAHAQSESTLPSSMGGWKHLALLWSIAQRYRSVREVSVWLPDWITFSCYGSLCCQTSIQCSCDSFPESHNSIHFQSCDSVILSVLAYKTSHNFVYSH